VPTCAHCSLFPCDGHWHQETNAKLTALRAGLVAADIIAVRPLPPERPPLVGLPASSVLPEAHREGLPHVHAILAAFRAGTARATYAGRHQQKRPLRHVGGTLWSLARGGRLVGDGGGYLCLDKDECGARRSQFPDPEHAKQLEALRLPGVRTESFYKPAHTPRHRDNAEFRLFVDRRHGGRATLEALRWYAGVLCRAHGEPLYKGGSQWTGDAYRRFLAADMTSLPR
jgi:hypothetical protein